MDADLKAKWVEALRSGNFKQGKEKLYNSEHDCYCCLGVLCVVAGATFKPFTEFEGEEDARSYELAAVLGDRVIGGGDEELKFSFAREVGLSEQAHFISMNDGYTSTICPENNVREYSFSEIADYIEREL